KEEPWRGLQVSCRVQLQKKASPGKMEGLFCSYLGYTHVPPWWYSLHSLVVIGMRARAKEKPPIESGHWLR
ncbi:hypothetical protein, partial [uncultured Desulfovibrio sp.]|uniref:hypothetical protein n=1 Tax=uncultured Desulfovibrio sp. TaxID=167968 RepID=UPI0026093FE5